MDMAERERLLANTYDLWTKRLLDLGGSNRLLNFDPRRPRLSTVRITSPSLAALVDRLEVDEKPLRFPWVQRQAAPAGATVFDQRLPEDEQIRKPAVIPGDVETDKDATELERSLRRIEDLARSAQEERGINILYLALGMLEWSPSDSPNARQRAPLFLVPVELQRRDRLSAYTLEPFDEDPEVNSTLAHVLEAQYRLRLPRFEEEVNGTALERFLETVEQQIRSRGWQVHHEAWLGLFEFKRLTMYEDLKAHREEAAQHAIVAAIAGISPGREPADIAEEQVDEVDPQEIFTVLDADSSQTKVMLLARQGESLVVEGPPGTGKSQTIANLIAQLLRDGKRVLFVSEKMAALEVVYRRLQQVGLGPYCLEMHSDKAKKGQVIGHIRTALNQASKDRIRGAGADERLRQLLDQRRRLNAYVAALHQPVVGGRTAYQLHGDLAVRSGAPTVAAHIDIRRAEAEPDWEIRATTAIRALAQHSTVWADRMAHPWYGYTGTSASPAIQADVQSELETLRKNLEAVRSLTSRVASHMGIGAPEQIEALAPFLGAAEHFAASPCPPLGWLTSDSAKELRSQALDLQTESHAYWRDRRRLEERYHQTFFTLPAAALHAAATERSDELRALFGEDEDWRERLAEQGHTIEQALDRLATALRTMHRVANRSQQLAGLEEVVSISEVEQALSLLSLLASDLQPLPRWFDPVQVSEAQDLAGAAAQRAARLRELKERLLSQYDAAVLEASVPEPSGFVNHWSMHTWLRALHPGYRAFKRHLTSLAKKGEALTNRAVLQTARDLARMKTLETEQEQHAPALRECLGFHFQGERTNWSDVLRQLEAAADLVRTCGGAVPESVRVLFSSAAARRELRTLAEEGQRAHDEARGLLAQLDELQLGWSSNLASTTLADRFADFAAALRTQLETLRTVTDTLRNEGSATLEQQVADLAKLCRLQEQEAAIGRTADALLARYGGAFSGVSTDWGALLQQLAWAERYLQLAAPLGASEAAMRAATDATTVADVGAMLPELRAATSGLISAYDRAAARFAPGSFPVRGAGQPVDLAALQARVAAALGALGGMDEWVTLRQALAECESCGLHEFVEAAQEAGVKAGDLEAAFLKRLRSLQCELAHDRLPELKGFDAKRHRDLVEQFCKLDQDLMKAYAQLVVRDVASRVPTVSGAAGGAASFLARELQKSRRFAPLRKLFQESGSLIAQITPCFLMSPLSVATHLPKGALTFDVVIFDEASQMPAEDAIGAVLRAKQLIVTGDSKQLPPTSFFQKQLEDGEDIEDEEEATVTPPLESVLNDCSTTLPTTSLQWHYRSRHESLIAFSNLNFYENRLITFPTRDAVPPDGLGIRHVYVPDGVYDRGRSSTNRREAEKVADLVAEHFQRYGTRRSLGVIALSEKQREAIERALEKHQAYPSFADLLRQGDEPFFLKPLENVQGDERDDIILSIGYGRTADGKLPRTFGPLNQEGGERRLNVAVTRARFRLTLVSSIKAEELDPTGLMHQGARLLKDYLAFAATGTLPATGSGPMQDAESPFEQAVWQALTDLGFQVDRQVGCSGYRIDLAVRDPDQPGRYLIGIECDGATYHSLKSARDRDRLRQQHLENMGWRIHRIWSTEWVRDPAGALERARKAIEDARNGDDASSGSEEDDPPPTTEPEGGGGQVPGPQGGTLTHDTRSEDDPYAPYTGEYRLANLPRRSRAEWETGLRLAEDLARLVREEGPVHWDRVLEAVPGQYDINRAGKHIRARLELAKVQAQRQGLITSRGRFLWPPGVGRIAPRRPAQGVTRKIRQVPPEEVEEAALLVVWLAHTIDRESLTVQLARVLGYRRTGSDIAAAVKAAVQRLLESGRLASDGPGLRLTEQYEPPPVGGSAATTEATAEGPMPTAPPEG